MWRAWWPALAGGLAVATVLGSNLPDAGDSQPLEPAMRAAFVYHLTRFVEWPATTTAPPAGDCRVAVWGDPAAVPPLMALLRGKTIAGRPVTVVAARRPEELTGCQVVFISRRLDNDVGEALAHCALRGTLTIGEDIDDLAGEVVVTFALRDDHIHFTVNREAAHRAGLRLSSHLLSLASPVATATSARRD